MARRYRDTALITVRLSSSETQHTNHQMDYSNQNGTDLLALAIDGPNKSPVQNSFAMFPPEMLSLICGFLHKDVLKQVRQVSKMWEYAAVPFLFDEIFISQDSVDFRIAKLVIRRFRHYIRTIVFSSYYYKTWNREDFKKYRVEPCNIVHDDDHTFTIYCFMRNEQQASITKGTCSAYLKFALTSLPKVRKIILTDTCSSRSMPQQSLQVYTPRRLKASPFKQCDRTAAEHLPYAVCESGFSRTGSTNPWGLLLSALSATNANVKELTMEPDDMELSINTAAFSMSPSDLSQAMLYFHNLTKLRLSLSVDVKRFSAGLDRRHVHENVAKLLSNALNLESLSLDLSGEDCVFEPQCCSLQEILGQCKFFKLRSLILGFFDSSDEELLWLLNHSKRLEQITINCHTLTEGSWMRVADWIRASLPLLKHAELNQLYGGFDEPINILEYMDLYGDVGNFLFGSGENPFTKKALEKYHADKESGRRVLSATGGLGHINAYTEYH